MGQIVKCHQCGEQGEKGKDIERIEIETFRKRDAKDKKSYKKYDKHIEKTNVHIQCKDQYIKQRKFKDNEWLELDSLTETLKKILGMKTVPNNFYSYLQDLRNGNEFFGNYGDVNFKKGYSYKVIEETYNQNIKAIEWAKMNKNFKDSFSFFLYTKAIIKNKIEQVYQQMKRKEKQEKVQKMKEAVQEDIDRQTFEEIKIQKTDNKDELDISKWL